MKRVDYVSFGLSILLNLLIILLIPGLSVETIVDKKIKVGLVSYDNNSRLKMEGTKNTNSKTKNLTAETRKKTEKIETQVKKESTVKKEPVTQVKAKEPEKKPTLSDIAKSISGPEIDVLSGISDISHSVVREKVKTIPKRQNDNKEGVVSKDNLVGEKLDLASDSNMNIQGKEQFLVKEDGKLAFNSEEGKDLEFERILKADGDVEGLPSGYRLGTEDGNIVARWDNTNREPVYPESAQLRGLHGTVKIRMNIDENGNVNSLFLEKGSGVPEINSAIEEIGRTWKIYLSKNGMNVKGDVILEYNFTLRGKN